MINKNLCDEDIVKSIIQGFTDNFSLIIERYQQKIFSIGIRFFKNEDDARDFTQELFIKVFNKLNTFKAKSAFKYWLIKIAYNMGINQIKSIKEKNIQSLTELDSQERSLENKHINQEIRDTLEKAICKLPANYKICIDLYFFWGLSYKEISSIANIPLNTIKSNVLRAKKILYTSLKGTIAEEYYEMR